MEFKEIEEIFRLFEKSKKVGKFRLKTKSGVEVSLERTTQNYPQSQKNHPTNEMLQKSNQELLQVPEKKEYIKEEFEQSLLPRISSPMVGTYYHSPSPEEPPFVTKGSQVNKGDIVCIIEAMKVMNEVKAECSGVVKEVHVKDGDPVEFESLLMTVQP